METEINLEFFSESQEHLRQLERQLKQVRDTDVGLLVPRDASAPALIAIGIKKGGERMMVAARQLAQVLYNFLHSAEGAAEQNQLLLLTIEGNRADIATLSVEEIERIILAAKEGEQS